MEHIDNQLYALKSGFLMLRKNHNKRLLLPKECLKHTSKHYGGRGMILRDISGKVKMSFLLICTAVDLHFSILVLNFSSI